MRAENPETRGKATESWAERALGKTDGRTSRCSAGNGGRLSRNRHSSEVSLKENDNMQGGTWGAQLDAKKRIRKKKSFAMNNCMPAEQSDGWDLAHVTCTANFCRVRVLHRLQAAGGWAVNQMAMTTVSAGRPAWHGTCTHLEKQARTCTAVQLFYTQFQVFHKNSKLFCF